MLFPELLKERLSLEVSASKSKVFPETYWFF